MKKTLFIFDNGMRSTSEGNIMISTGVDVPFQEIDLTDATPDEFQKVRQNPHDAKLLHVIHGNIAKRKDENNKLTSQHK